MTPPIDGLEINESNASTILKKDEFKDLTVRDLEILLQAKQQESKSKTKKDFGHAGESKEKMKTPALEKSNHKIDANKSKKEKLAEGWKEEERPAYINGTETKIKVLKKEIAKGAYVREYQDDGKMPAHLVGEQLFNWKAVLSLGLQDRLPTWENMQTMRGGEDHEEFMENNFQKEGKNVFPGYLHPDPERFVDVDGWVDCWLAEDGYGIAFDEYHMRRNHGPEFGFSLRLLKSA